MYFKVAFYVREFEFICKYLNHDFFCPCEQKENFEQCAFHTCYTFFMINKLELHREKWIARWTWPKSAAPLWSSITWQTHLKFIHNATFMCHASNKHPTIPTPKHYFFKTWLWINRILRTTKRTIWAFRFSHLQWFHKWKSFTFLWGCLTLTKATQSEHALLPSGV